MVFTKERKNTKFSVAVRLTNDYAVSQCEHCYTGSPAIMRPRTHDHKKLGLSAQVELVIHVK